MAEETVNINPDGSTTFEGSGATGGGGEESTMPPVADEQPGIDEETMEEVIKGTDPAIYLLLAVVLIGFLYFLYTRKARADGEDEFFATLEDEKVRRGWTLVWQQVFWGALSIRRGEFLSLGSLTLCCCCCFQSCSSISSYRMKLTSITLSKKNSSKLVGSLVLYVFDFEMMVDMPINHGMPHSFYPFFFTATRQQRGCSERTAPSYSVGTHEASHGRYSFGHAYTKRVPWYEQAVFPIDVLRVPVAILPSRGSHDIVRSGRSPSRSRRN